jgi:hypothetical protein
MSAAQWLVGGICAVMALTIFMLMRYPRFRRDHIAGEPFALTTSLLGAAVMLTIGAVFVWAQGRFEGP